MIPPGYPEGGPPVGRRAILGMLAALAGCQPGGGVSGLTSLTGRFEAMPSEGRMVARVPTAPRDAGKLAAEQERVLRLQRAEAPYGLVHAPEFHAYLDGVTRRLLRVAPGPELPARVHVVTSRDWSANATGPGLVFVPLALIERLDDEDQLAFVVGHELGHVLLRHHDADWVVKGQKQALAVASLAMAARETVQPRGGAGGREDTAAAFLAAETVLAVSDKMLAPAWTRQQEHQADLIGIDLMVAAGYNPDAAVEVLERIAQWTRGAGQPYLETPRQLARRTAAARRSPREDGLDVQGIWATMLDAVRGAFDGLAESHPDPEKRLELVQTYVPREYPRVKRPAARVAPWRAARTRPQMQEVLARYGSAYEARARMRERDLRGAERLALDALGGVTRAHHFPRYTLAEVYARRGRLPQAREQLLAAMDAPEPALEAHIGLASLDERRGRAQDAVAVLEAARGQFGDHPRAWPYLIWLYRRTRRERDASELQLRCQVEFPEFQALCAEPRRAARAEASGGAWRGDALREG